MGFLRRDIDAPFSRKSFVFWMFSPVLFLVSLAWARVAKKRRLRGYAHFPSVPSGLQYPRVICCGNVIVGGTGKSPVVRHLAQEFLANNNFVAIVARGIGEDLPEGAAVSPAAADLAEKLSLRVLNVSDLSDENREHFELLRMFCPGSLFVIFQGRNRLAALNSFAALAAARERGVANAVAILDDGLQHFKAPRHVNLCLWDPEILKSAPLMSMPVGPFREGMGRDFRNLLESFDARLWSRCYASQTSKFLSNAQQALARFQLNLGTRDYVVMSRQIFFQALVQRGEFSLSHLCPSEVIFGKAENVLCITGLARGDLFLRELKACFEGVQFTHVELPDHSALNSAAFDAMQKADCLILSGKDFFRWCATPGFVSCVQAKRLVVCTVDVVLRTVNGESASPLQLWAH